VRVALTHVHCWPEVRRGGERYLHEVAAALARRGHAVTIVSSASHASRTTEGGVDVLRRRGHPPSPDRRADAAFGRKVLLPLLRGRFDVVHSLGPSDAAASIRVGRMRGHRTVYTNLGNPDHAWWDTQPDGAAHRRVVAKIDVYGCLSKYAAGCLQRDFGREGVLTPGGVSLDRFTPAPRRATQPTLLFSGAIDDPRKGVASLLEAVAILAARGVDVRLRLSGSGDATRLLAAAPPAARERTEILPLDGPAEQSRRYGEAWATVLPSAGEAFGLALLESLACGTPIVGNDDAALPELVSPKVGALATVGDPGSLADACEHALELSRVNGIVDVCRDVAAAYDWDATIAPDLEAIYDRAT
jgi:phosphatidyl-myo-inositol alpha-mannosyltransferase